MYVNKDYQDEDKYGSGVDSAKSQDKRSSGGQPGIEEPGSEWFPERDNEIGKDEYANQIQPGNAEYNDNDELLNEG